MARPSYGIIMFAERIAISYDFGIFANGMPWMMGSKLQEERTGVKVDIVFGRNTQIHGKSQHRVIDHQ